MTDLPDEHDPSPMEHGADVEPDPDLDVAVSDDVAADLSDDFAASDPSSRASVSTGHPAVDEVLRSLEGLDGRPVDEHVAAFEEAHEVLRRALSHAGDDPVARRED